MMAPPPKYRIKRERQVCNYEDLDEQFTQFILQEMVEQIENTWGSWKNEEQMTPEESYEK